jgi:DNA polymerase delta subunit 1
MVIEEIDASGVVFVNWPLREDGEVLEEDELLLANKWVVVKDDVSPADIFRLHCGSDADRAKVGKYCLQDCDLVLELYRKLEVFNNSMSMANVCCVPISYIFVRGQGIKAESLMFRACRERGTLIPVLGKPSQGPADSYEGAIVLDPVPGFYSKAPIGVADFASLYPSSIESENISHDSLVWTRDFDAEGNLIAEVFASDVPESAIDRSKYGLTDIEFDLLRVDPEDKRKHPAKIKAGLRIGRYAQPLDGTKATVPEIIRGLLAARKAKRKELAKETDPMRKSLLDAEQLAYKLTGNSLYGQLGSGTFKVRLQHLAASITAYGRKQIMFAKEVIDNFYGPGKHPRCVANVMYGDTDSLFIEFAVKDASGTPLTGREARQAVIDLTAEAGKLVTKALAPPHDFEFDKVFDPMLMFSKKRYAGFMFEENADDYVTKYMGIALKRRDNAPIVKTVYGTAMRKLLLDRDVAGATKYVQDACMDLVRGKVKLGQLTITKSLRAEYANPLQIAHKALADRMAARDPGNAPASGDRIPFVYVQPPVGSQAAKLQGDRVEAPSYIKEHGLTPDYEFYLGHQLQNPISQMFGLLLEEMPGTEGVPWSQKPEDMEKQLIWKEQMAAQILFGKAFQACNKHHRSAFVSRFFGLSEAKSVASSVTTSIKADSKESVTANTGTVPAFMNHQIVKPSEDKKPVQATLSSFMKYEFVVKTIQKIERTKKAAAKKEAKAKEQKAVEKPKNEIIVDQ